MILISLGYNGLIAHCDTCGALIGYDANDIFADGRCKCPQCNEWIQTNMIPQYDGVVKEKENER